MAPAREVLGLKCDDSFRCAAGKILWTRFEEMMSFRNDALLGRDPEGVHDMRVAARRLRAALELFRDVFPKRRFRPMLKDVRQLADALGEVRDLDVMLESLGADVRGRPASQRIVLVEMIEEMQERQKDARTKLKETIEALERLDFPRQFLIQVANETT